MIEHEGLVLARLGSRFALRFEPQTKRLFSSPLGIGFERPLRLEISILINGTRLVWPFSAGNPFESGRIKRTPSKIEFICRSSAAGVELAAAFSSPFYPHDEKVSCAPFFYLDIVCRRILPATEKPAELKVSLFGREGETVAREGTQVLLQTEYELKRRFFDEAPDEFSQRRFQALTALIPLSGRMSLKETTFTVPLGSKEESARATFALAAHCGQPALEVEGIPHRLRCLKWFPALNDLAAYARAEEAEIRRKTAFFDKIIAQTSLDMFEKDCLAQSLQAFLSRTWWTEEEGLDWFSCWNERDAQNDLASEYKALSFYLNLWPELLEKLLSQRAEWALKLSASKHAAVQETIMAAANQGAEPANRDPAPSDHGASAELFFPISCGRALSITHAAARDARAPDICDYILMLFAHWRWLNQFELIRRSFELIRKLSLSLLDAASGVQAPDNGSFDSGIALRLLCAASAAALMADEAGDEELAQRLLLTERALSQALEANPQPLHELDALLPLIMCDHLPGLDQRLALKAFSSATAHSSNGASLNSQDSLLQQITGAYFGFNFLQSQRYQEDAPASPEGATAFGLIQALLGLKIDRVEQTLCLSPLCVPARLPLLPFADWPRRRVPWVETRGEGHQIKMDIAGNDLLGGFDLAVYPHRELRARS